VNVRTPIIADVLFDGPVSVLELCFGQTSLMFESRGQAVLSGLRSFVNQMNLEPLPVAPDAVFDEGHRIASRWR